MAQLLSGWHILHSSSFFTAELARKYVWLNAAAVALIALVAIAAPGRWRWLAVGAPCALLLAVLTMTAIPGGQLTAMLSAILTMAAAWEVGERLLHRLGASDLAGLALVAWLVGIGPLSLFTSLLGRISLLRWWTGGLVIIALGTLGTVRLLTRIYARRSVLLHEIGHSSLSLAGAGLLLVIFAWTAIYTAAPEIQFDSLYAKEYLPQLWAQTGHIGSLASHVQLEVTGWFQTLAVYGHLLGGDAVGRYMQLLGLMFTAIAVWWWGRRHGALGPLAAVAVAVTPHLFWQASTADDDLLLAACGLAMCFAVVETIRRDPGDRIRSTAFALGLMAGSGPSLKLHLIPLFAMLALTWICAGRASRTIRSRLGFASLGAAVTSLPPLVLRWIDSGNPVLPAYNNIFHSRYWLPVNEKANFPFWQHPGLFGPVKAIWTSVLNPSLLVEDAPPGAFGMLIGAVVFALLFGWAGRERSRANFAVWLALLPALVYWWVDLRYLRYLLPISFVAVALMLMVLGDVRPRKNMQRIGVLGVALAAIASFPVTIGQFWNVPTHKPPIYAAIGRWNASSYEQAAFPGRLAMLAFNRLSPPGSLMATDSFQRAWMTGGRDLDSLHYEVIPRLERHGPLPTNGNQAFVDLRAIGVGWVLVTEASRLLNQSEYLSQVLTLHGKIEFSALGWDLYRLVDKPPTPVPVSECDRARVGVPACWGGSRSASGDLTTGVIRTVPVCSGQILAVSLTQAGGNSSPMLIQFVGGDPHDSPQTGYSHAGSAQYIYATVPSGAMAANVTVSPIEGAEITAASIGTLGPSCHSEPDRSTPPR
ncbi:MAG TPA: hypothetical protein VGG98_05225 [Solirubrobacteraceae bacterium]